MLILTLVPVLAATIIASNGNWSGGYILLYFVGLFVSWFCSAAMTSTMTVGPTYQARDSRNRPSGDRDFGKP
jgi:hypothetical protein